MQFVVISTQLNLAPFEPGLLRGSVFYVFHTTFAVSSLLISLSSSPNGPGTAGRRRGLLAGKRPCSASLLILAVAPFWLPGEEAARGSGTGSVVL